MTPGTKMRVVDTEAIYGAEVGDTVTIVEPDEGDRRHGWVAADVGGYTQSFRPEQLEPL